MLPAYLGPMSRTLLRMWIGPALLALAFSAAAQDGTKVGGWSLYRDFTFTGESDAIREEDRTKAREVAQHMVLNPMLRIGLDGMNQGRVSSVREALIQAGVPDWRINSGTFGEPHMRGARRVLVLVGR
jgi:hypothetical protein